MKILISALAILLSINATADGMKFKTIAQARSAALHAICFTRTNLPQLTFTFDQSFGFEGSAGALVLVQPQVGIFVRDWTTPGVGGVPINTWTVSPFQGDMTITGQWSSPFNEQLVLKITENTVPKVNFVAHLDYNNYSTGKSVSRDVRCYLTDGNWKL